MKHFSGCSCEACRGAKPIPQQRAGGFLMRQIVGEGTQRLCCERFRLCVEGLPDACGQTYQLLQVCARGEACVLDARADARRPGCVCATVRVPLALRARDCAGCVCEGTSFIDVPVVVRLRDCGGQTRYQFEAEAQVQLCTACPLQDAQCVEASLDVCAQVWAIARRAMYPAACPPPCPPMPPLYPEPCRPAPDCGCMNPMPDCGCLSPAQGCARPCPPPRPRPCRPCRPPRPGRGLFD